jgi:hypothetical protein
MLQSFELDVIIVPADGGAHLNCSIFTGLFPQFFIKYFVQYELK